MSKTYPKLDRTKFPDATDVFILFQDPNSDVSQLLSEYEMLLAGQEYASAANLIKQHTELEPYIMNADRMNHMLHAIIAMEQFYMSDVRKSIMDIVTWRGTYNASTTYDKFDVVVSDPGSIIAYMSIHDDSFKGIAPPHDDYWIRITLQGQPGTGLTYAGTWNSSTNYQTDNWVYYNNVIWVSTISDNLNHKPVEDSDYWFAIFRNIQHIVCSATAPENQYVGDLWLKSSNGTHVIKEKQSDGSYKDIYLDMAAIKTSTGSTLESYIATAIANSSGGVIGGITPESIGAAPASHGHAAGEITAGTLNAGVIATNGTDYSTSRLRNIMASTTDIGVGAALPSGSIYIVYE